MELHVYSGYYYSRLSEGERRLYDALVKGWDEYRRSVTVNGLGGKVDFAKVCSSIDKDIPEFFFVNYATAVMYAWDDGHVSVRVKFYYPESEIRALRKQLRLAADGITRRIKGGFEEKVAAVHDYLTDNVTYRLSENPECRTVVGALLRKEGVCAAISRAFKLLCDELKIPAMAVSGVAYESGKPDVTPESNHCWVMVRDVKKGMNYHIDPTWDMPKSGNARRLYFLLSDRLLRFNHSWDTRSLPPCRENRFDGCGIATVKDIKSLRQAAARYPRCFLYFDKAFAPPTKEAFESLLQTAQIKNVSYLFDKTEQKAIIIRQ